MNLTFHGTTLADISAQLSDFLHDIGYSVINITSVDTNAVANDNDPTSGKPSGEKASPASRRQRTRKASASETSSEDTEPKKRRRGRKTTSEPTEPATSSEPDPTSPGETPGQDDKPVTATASPGRRGRASSASTDATSEETPEPTTRRRRARTSGDAEDKGAQGRRRTARAATPSPSDDLKDTDLSKAASGLADATNPKVVMDLLEEFEVTKVGELEGDARREFLTAAAKIVADA